MAENTSERLTGRATLAGVGAFKEFFTTLFQMAQDYEARKKITIGGAGGAQRRRDLGAPVAGLWNGGSDARQGRSVEATHNSGRLIQALEELGAPQDVGSLATILFGGNITSNVIINEGGLDAVPVLDLGGTLTVGRFVSYRGVTPELADATNAERPASHVVVFRDGQTAFLKRFPERTAASRMGSTSDGSGDVWLATDGRVTLNRNDVMLDTGDIVAPYQFLQRVGSVLGNGVGPTVGTVTICVSIEEPNYA